MGTLDKVIEMQKQGVSDAEISTQLQNEGISPTEIDDSFNQSKIKNAISPPENPAPEQAPPQGMHESIMPGTSEGQTSVEMPPSQPEPQQSAQPMTQEIPAQPAMAPQTPSPEIYPQE